MKRIVRGGSERTRYDRGNHVMVSVLPDPGLKCDFLITDWLNHSLAGRLVRLSGRPLVLALPPGVKAA